MMMSVQWQNITVRLDGLIHCLLTMEESFVVYVFICGLLKMFSKPRVASYRHL